MYMGLLVRIMAFTVSSYVHYYLQVLAALISINPSVLVWIPATAGLIGKTFTRYPDLGL